MSNMNRKETSILFKAQTRMLPIKNNCRTKYKDLIRRGCKAENETEQHVLQMCKEIHKNNNIKVDTTDYFSEDIEVLKKTAQNIQFILQRIEQSDVPTAQQSLSVQPGTRDTARQ
jgi:hypothetical protein